jgi:hypothetical protein
MRQGRDLQELEARRLDVRYWPKADIPTVAMNVRFRGE